MHSTNVTIQKIIDNAHKVNYNGTTEHICVKGGAYFMLPTQMLNSAFPLYHNQLGYAARDQSTTGALTYQPTKHEMYELYFFCQGDAVFKIDGEDYPLKPLDMVIIPPNVEHLCSLQNFSAPYERALIYVSAELLEMIACGILSFGSMLMKATSQKKYVFPLPADLFDRIRSLIKCIICRNPLKNPYDHLLDFSNILQICVLICEHIESLIVFEAGNAPSITRRIIEYIHNNLSYSLDKDSIANLFGISKVYLNRLVKKATSMTPHTYILFCRVQYARHLLAGGLTPTQACYQCGFNDYSSFLRAFKKFSGLLPSDFKNSVLASTQFEHFMPLSTLANSNIENDVQNVYSLEAEEK